MPQTCFFSVQEGCGAQHVMDATTGIEGMAAVKMVGMRKKGPDEVCSVALPDDDATELLMLRTYVQWREH
jgi:hypothetical protein